MNSSGSWRILVTGGAKKQIKRIPRREADRIESAFDEMEMNPFGGDVVKLGGENDTWRRRIGSYRILFKVLSADKTIFIREVTRRTSSTY